MKTRIIPLVCLAVLNSLLLSGQSVAFSYDANGNMTGKIIVLQQLQQNTLSFPVLNPELMQIQTQTNYAKGLDNNDISSQDDKVIINVYPNPSTGFIRIDIENNSEKSDNELFIYDLSGRPLIHKQKYMNKSEVDLTGLRDGVYVLRLRINKRIFDWKVIKSEK